MKPLRTLLSPAARLILSSTWLALVATNACAQVLVAEPFDYPDGPLVGAAGSSWVENYPAGEPLEVIGGRLRLEQTATESVRVDFPHTTSDELFARFRVTFTGLPKGAGNYFAFFRQTNVDNNRALVWAATNGAAGGKFRLGLRTFSTTSPVMIPVDLVLHQTYTVVLRYDVATRDGTLWIDPAGPDDFARRADAAGLNLAVGVAHFGLLQAARFGPGDGTGDLFVDDLVIGRTFYEVWDGPRFTGIHRLAGDAFQLVGAGVPEVRHTLLGASAADTEEWIPLGEAVADTAGRLEFNHAPTADSPNQFFRLRAEPSETNNP